MSVIHPAVSGWSRMFLKSVHPHACGEHRPMRAETLIRVGTGFGLNRYSAVSSAVRRVKAKLQNFTFLPTREIKVLQPNPSLFEAPYQAFFVFPVFFRWPAGLSFSAPYPRCAA